MPKTSHAVTAGELVLLPRGTGFVSAGVHAAMKPDDGPTYPPPPPPWKGASVIYPIVKVQEAVPTVTDVSKLVFKIESPAQVLQCILEIEEVGAKAPSRRSLTNSLSISVTANQDSLVALDASAAGSAQQLFLAGNALKLYVHYTIAPVRVTLGTAS